MHFWSRQRRPCVFARRAIERPKDRYREIVSGKKANVWFIKGGAIKDVHNWNWGKVLGGEGAGEVREIDHCSGEVGSRCFEEMQKKLKGACVFGNREKW